VFLVSEMTLHSHLLEAPATNSNPASVLTVLGGPQNRGFFLDGAHNRGRQLCCGAKRLHDAWDDMIKQEEEGVFLTCVSACVCGYVFTCMYT